MPGLPADTPCPHQAAGRAGQQQVYRLAAGQRGIDRAAAALHDRHRRRGECGIEPLEVTGHARSDPGIQPGGDTALIFLVFGQHLRGARDEQPLWQPRLDRAFVAVVEKGKQQVDRHRLRPELPDQRQQPGTVGIRQGGNARAVRTQARTDLPAQLARHRRRLGSGLQVIQLAARLAADGEHVGQPAVGDIGRAHALALQRGVGGHGGPVHDMQPGSGQAQLPDTLEDGAFRRGRRRQHLVDAQPFTVEQYEVGESAAGIDAQPAPRVGCAGFSHRARIVA